MLCYSNGTDKNCSPLNVLFRSVYITLILHGVPPLGGVKQGWGGKTSYFEAKFLNISKTVGDTTKVTIND